MLPRNGTMRASTPSRSMIGRKPRPYLIISWLASRRLSMLTPAWTSVRMRSSTVQAWSRRTSKSLSVMMPRSLAWKAPESVTGKVEYPVSAMIWMTSAIGWRGDRVRMLVWKPALKRLTRRILSHCASRAWLTGRMPMPPSWATAMAISMPVTACMAAVRKGVRRRRKSSPRRHNRVVRSTLRALPSGGV